MSKISNWANRETLLVPDDVRTIIELMAKELGSTRQVAILMALRRGMEVLYGGREHLPVKNWDAFTYEYKERKKKSSRAVKIKLADETY
jgi:hypothetical protein